MAGSLKVYAAFAGLKQAVLEVYAARNALAADLVAFKAATGIVTFDAAGVRAAFPGLPAAVQNEMGALLSELDALRARLDLAADSRLPANDLPAGP